ncbi:MAG: ATP-binding protein, partial [Bacteroidota bacterium]
KARADEKENKLIVSLDSCLPKLVKGDPNRLHQILINLIGNAIKFTHHGEIRISTKAIEKDADTYLVSFFIKDTGIGISKENVNSVFETFTQAKGQRNRKHGGSGLGLSIVKKLLELYGGTIALHSELGKGSEFKVEIPLQKVADNEIEKEQEPINLKDNALDGLNILLAEDNRFNQLLETRILENLGASVTLAENGREAIDLLKNGKYHLILMDIQMPEMDGIDATRFIREEMKRDLPIIALTANAFKQELDKCLDIGMNSCVTKPFKKEVLVKKILENVPKMA